MGRIFSSTGGEKNKGEIKTYDDESSKTSALVTKKYFKFDDGKEDNKESFEGAIDIFCDKDTRRRGSVEFIYAAMRNMEKFGVHRDLGTYKKLMDVFPKGKMIPSNRLESDFFHYPKQQQCATSLLHKMENNKVMPDEEMGDIILNVYGKYSTPYKRYCRLGLKTKFKRFERDQVYPPPLKVQIIPKNVL